MTARSPRKERPAFDVRTRAVVAVTPGDHGSDRDLVSLAEGLVRGGLRWIVLREPQLDERSYVTLARQLAPLFPDGVSLHGKHESAASLAERAGWHLHLPWGANLKDVRARIRGRLGVSCHNAIEVAAAKNAGVDYLFFAPVFKPTSKPDDRRKPAGVEELARAVESAGVPVYAQGGIDPSRVQACLEVGAAGVVVTGALFPVGVVPEEADALCRALTGRR